MTLLHHAGYRTVTLDQFVRFIRGEQVGLPPRPLLLTFDDARADSWIGGDGIIRKLGFNAVMFVDVGRVDSGDREYLTWSELATMRHSGRWDLQLHAGEGHHYIRYGPAEDDVGPFYAYREDDESFARWKERAFGDLEWGREQLDDHVDGLRPLAFAPPYGNYGQQGTNDKRIPETLLDWLVERYEAVFTQDQSLFSAPRARQPVGRLQIDRNLSGGDLRAALENPSGSP